MMVDHNHLDSYLCEYLGWTDIDSPDGISLRGINPCNGKVRLVPSHSYDYRTSSIMLAVILDVMRYPDGARIAYKAEAVQYNWRIVLYKAGTNEEEKFEGKDQFCTTATAIAALAMFEKLGPLPELPIWYGHKKIIEQYRAKPYRPRNSKE